MRLLSLEQEVSVWYQAKLEMVLLPNMDRMSRIMDKPQPRPHEIYKRDIAKLKLIQSVQVRTVSPIRSLEARAWAALSSWRVNAWKRQPIRRRRFKTPSSAKTQGLSFTVPVSYLFPEDYVIGSVRVRKRSSKGRRRRLFTQLRRAPKSTLRGEIDVKSLKDRLGKHRSTNPTIDERSGSGPRTDPRRQAAIAAASSQLYTHIPMNSRTRHYEQPKVSEASLVRQDLANWLRETMMPEAIKRPRDSWVEKLKDSTRKVRHLRRLKELGIRIEERNTKS